MRLERGGSLAIVVVSGLLSLTPLLAVPSGIDATFGPGELEHLSWLADNFYEGTSFPSDPGLVLPIRGLAFGLILFIILLSLALAWAICWSDEARRAHWPIAAFLTALPVAISWEYVLLPLGMGGGPLTDPYLVFVRIGAALLFVTSVVMLPRFAAGFPNDLRTTGEHLFDKEARRVRAVHILIKSPHFARGPLPEELVTKRVETSCRMVARLYQWWLLPTVAISFALLRLVSEVLFGSDFFFGYILAFLALLSFSYTYRFLGAQLVGPQGDRVHWISAGVGAAMIGLAVMETVSLALARWDVQRAAVFGFTPFLMLALIIGGLGLAVLYQGAIDPRLAIRRTTVYGALGVLFIVLFAVVESLVSELLEARLGLPSMLGAAFSGAVVALIVIPLRGRFSRWTDRWIPESEKAAGKVPSSDIA